MRTAQTGLVMVTLEQRVSKASLRRLIDRPIHFDFIREATAHRYCANTGRPEGHQK
jgi:hypothetical protein